MASPILAICHYVFLTKEQRYALIVPEVEIEVVGMCCYTWKNNGLHEDKFIDEIFAKYVFRHCPKPEKQTINFTDEGFLVRLSPNMPKYLLDYQDEGHMNLNLNHKNAIISEDRIIPVMHYLNIDDMKILEQTLC